MSDEAVTMKKSTLMIASIVVVFAFGFLLGRYVFPEGVTGAAVATGQPQAAGATADDDPVLGNPNAEVTIIEFSDYQCPFCRKFWTDTLPQIEKEYIGTGKVKLVFRDFPLSFHPNAGPAAEAANCAREKGGDEAYYKMHDKIFSEQNKLDGGTVQSTIFDGWDSKVLKQWAKDLGYDIGSCLDSGKYASEVQKDFDDGANAGVSGTPAFFVNGQILEGAQPFSVFKQVIDSKLGA